LECLTGIAGPDVLARPAAATLVRIAAMSAHISMSPRLLSIYCRLLRLAQLTDVLAQHVEQLPYR
jgi:hypothetical protein